MSRTRMMLVRLMLVGIVGLSLAAIAIDRDHGWPFLTYAMYASRRDPEMARAPMVVGVDARPPHEMVVVNLEPALRMLGAYQLTMSVERVVRRDGAQAARRALSDLLPVYERWREAGLVEGPPLKALRIVRARRIFKAAQPDAPIPAPAFEDPHAQWTIYVESLPLEGRERP